MLPPSFSIQAPFNRYARCVARSEIPPSDVARRHAQTREVAAASRGPEMR